ncbi:MAG: phenylalanine--tRNA ligase subunit beta [Deltaproteobacteria bacterium]|nr:phenylalanine--tRNA ligase subunit beta [Deltaproteobacteria bacterium]
MRVPVSLLSRLVPVNVGVETLAQTLNARVSEVERVEHFSDGDAVLEFDLEPNRPDLFSLVGVARDVAAIWNLPFKGPELADLAGLPVLASPTLDIRTPRCRRYEALLVEGVRVGPSPAWLALAVQKLGMRPINNVVDAANLAMLELGQPLHTFDADRIEHGSIVLRMASEGERITTLDGVERALTPECLLVCDGELPVAIAGVMGDARSEVSPSTTRVVIECAAFDMAAVRRASRRLSLRTEASTRFEKGLPVSGVRPALARLARLLSEVAGGRPVALAASGEELPAPTRIDLDGDMIRARLGMAVSDAEMHRLFASLGFDSGPGWVDVPESRPDLRIAQDLVEEVGRLHGYEHVASEAPSMPLAAPRENAAIVAARRLRVAMSALGWDEVYLPVWIGDEEVERFELDRGALVALLNPIAENYRYFRTSALPALAEAATQNAKEHAQFAIYEVGRVYRRGANGKVEERLHAAGIALGAEAELLAVRDAVRSFALAQGIDDAVSRHEHPHLHPGRTLRVGHACTVGELHPRLVRACGFRKAPVAFEIDLEACLGGRRSAVRYRPPHRFPTVDLDLNVEVGPRVEAGRVLDAVRAVAVASLREARVADVYPLPVGARLTLAFRFGAADRSLALDEAIAGLDAVRAALREQGWSPS